MQASPFWSGLPGCFPNAYFVSEPGWGVVPEGLSLP